MRATFRALGERGRRERGRRAAHRRRARLPRRAGAPARLRGGDLLRARRARASRGSTARSTRSAPATRSSTSPAGPRTRVIAGDDGLTVLAYGENHDPPLVRLPRAGMVRRGGLLARGLPRRPARARGRRRPARAARAHAAPAVQRRAARTSRSRPTRSGEFAIAERDVGRAAGLGAHRACATTSSPPGTLNCPPHWHAAEHELFVVLEGDGDAAALRQPGRARRGARAARRALRRRARPATRRRPRAARGRATA